MSKHPRVFGAAAWLIALVALVCGVGQLSPPLALVAAGFGMLLSVGTLIKFSIRIRRMLWAWTPIRSLPPFTFGEWISGASGMALFLGMIAAFALLVARHAA